MTNAQDKTTNEEYKNQEKENLIPAVQLLSSPRTTHHAPRTLQQKAAAAVALAQFLLEKEQKAGQMPPDKTVSRWALAGRRELMNKDILHNRV